MAQVDERRVPATRQVAAFFRYHGLWAPGVRLFRRLDFPAKAFIISVAFLVPLLVLSTSFVRAHLADADFVTAERHGVAYAQPVIALMDVMTRERQLARARARGEAASQLDTVRQRVDKAVSDLGAVHALHGPAFRTDETLTRALNQLKAVRALHGATPEQLFADYTVAIMSLQRLLEDVVDRSNLALDPEISTYYLMDASLVAAPDLFHAAGRLRGLLTTAAKAGRVERALGLRIQDEMQQVRRRTAQIQASVAKMAPEAIQGADFQTELTALGTASEALAALALTAVQEENLALSTDEVVHKGDAVVASTLKFMAAGHSVLDGLLKARQDDGVATLRLVMTLSVMCVALAAYLLKCFYMVTRGGLEEVRSHLVSMTQGDLTTSPRPWGRDEAASLMLSLAEMQHSLRQLVKQVRGSAEMIVHSSTEMADAARDLSARTENAAANLQQSASSVEEMASTVQQTANHAHDAAGLASRNAQVAAQGGQVITQVVDTMRAIQGSSGKIADIISVIDSIAFQTNILALNAAVEAARAGEQGRGFAVVASEVRALAQRSASAAREIKDLIQGSVAQVEQGTVVVESAGRTMEDIVGHARHINELLAQIANASREQSSGVGLVGQSMSDLDRDTQQNAAMVEQSAAASQGLRQQAMVLAEAVATFKLPTQLSEGDRRI